MSQHLALCFTNIIPWYCFVNVEAQVLDWQHILSWVILFTLGGGILVLWWVDSNWSDQVICYFTGFHIEHYQKLRCCTSVHLCWRGEINEHQGIQILSCLSSYVHIIPAVILRPIQPTSRKSSGEKRKIDKDEVDIMSVPMDPSTFLYEPVAVK